MIPPTGSENGRFPGAALNLLAFAAAVALLYYGRLLIITLILSTIAAFILEPLVNLTMRLRLHRGVASFVVCSAALLVVYLTGVGVYFQALNLIEDLPAYTTRLNELSETGLRQLDQTDESLRKLVPKRMAARGVQPPPAVDTKRRGRRAPQPDPVLPPQVQEVRIKQDEKPLFDYLYEQVSSAYNVLLMASFVPFLVYFMLSWSDHVRRGFLQMFEGASRQVAARSWEGVASMARAYMVGNFILGCLLALASTIFFMMRGVPYALLVGPISAFLSLVPYVGLPLAIIPPVFAALPVTANLSDYLILASTVAFFHLLALNLLYPKLVGARVHLNPLAVTIGLMFWGTIWGAMGLVLAIPLTAAIKAVCDNVRGLGPYGKLLGD